MRSFSDQVATPQAILVRGIDERRRERLPYFMCWANSDDHRKMAAGTQTAAVASRTNAKNSSSVPKISIKSVMKDSLRAGRPGELQLRRDAQDPQAGQSCIFSGPAKQPRRLDGPIKLAKLGEPGGTAPSNIIGRPSGWPRRRALPAGGLRAWAGSVPRNP